MILDDFVVVCFKGLFLLYYASEEKKSLKGGVVESWRDDIHVRR